MNKEQHIIEVANSILKEYNLDENTTNKIINSIIFNKSNHIYLDDNNILSINEHNQRLMYMKQDDFLIKMTNDYIEILFMQDDNIIISLKLDYEFKYYNINFNTLKEERNFEINSQQMSFIKQKNNLKYSHIFQKINHKDRDYQLLYNLITDAIGIKEIETEVINYLSTIYKDLSNIISNNINQTKSNLLGLSNKSRIRK